MRIAIVNTARNYGGQEAMAALLASQLRGRGHDILFLCRPVYPALDRLSADVRVEPILGGADWSPLAIMRARRALQRHRSEVMLVTTNKDMRSAALAAWSLGIPVVVRRAMARPLRGSAHYRFLYGRLPRHIVTNSDATRRIMMDSAPWVRPDTVSVIHNGIDLRPFEVGEPAALGVPPDALTVGFVGRFVEWKGVLVLADAWRAAAPQLPNVHLVLVGQGEMEAEMRSRLAGTERVHWLGFRNDIPAVMKAFDILCFPSRMEGFGLAAVEAMAAAVPVIAAEAGSLPEVVGHEREGLLVPPDSAEALTAALLRLAGDDELRRRLGTGGRERVRRDFSVHRMVEAYEQVLRRATDPHRASDPAGTVA
ncbi:MAG TPA: glycosyltransferase family 4 protein [Longimicrobiales bacterium]|nr:glycosyltransferase family 4 protein [Longimicrobiales bacterium]